MEFSLSNISGDSTVEQLIYRNGVAELLVIDYETEKRLCLRIPTRIFYSEASSEYGTAHIRVFSLAECLPIQQPSGRYIAPETFAQQMQASRDHLHLAYGLRASDFPWFFYIGGSNTILACPIPSESHISITYAAA
jgi:hypothetical protein